MARMMPGGNNANGGPVPMATSLPNVNPNTPQNVRTTPLGAGKGTPLRDSDAKSGGKNPTQNASVPPPARTRRSPIQSAARTQALVNIGSRRRIGSTGGMGAVMPAGSAAMSRNLPASPAFSQELVVPGSSSAKSSPPVLGEPGTGAKRMGPARPVNKMNAAPGAPKPALPGRYGQRGGSRPGDGGTVN